MQMFLTIIEKDRYLEVAFNLDYPFEKIWVHLEKEG